MKPNISYYLFNSKKEKIFITLNSDKKTLKKIGTYQCFSYFFTMLLLPLLDSGSQGQIIGTAQSALFEIGLNSANSVTGPSPVLPLSLGNVDIKYMLLPPVLFTGNESLKMSHITHKTYVQLDIK